MGITLLKIGVWYMILYHDIIEMDITPVSFFKYIWYYISR